MMAINASYTPDVFYQQTLSVAPNTNYEFGLWTVNMLRGSGINPNIQVEADRLVGGAVQSTQVIAASGNIDYANAAGGQQVGALVLSNPLPASTVPWADGYGGGLGLQWTRSVSGAATTSAAGDDAGDLTAASAVLRVGTLAAGDSGTLCFRAIIR